jgi:hypothetical protein
VQENPSHLGCEKCNVLFVDESELVTNFTREELKEIAGFLLKDWRVYCLAVVGLLIGVGVLYWQVHDRIEAQIEKFENSASNQVAAAYSVATNQIANKFDSFQQSASNQMAGIYSTTTNQIAIKLQSVEDDANCQIDKAYSSVTNQIAQEFQTSKIRQTVEAVAQGEAKSILNKEVQPAVESFTRDALFIRTVAHAQANDYKAYRRLLEITTGTNEDAKLANEVVSGIDRALERDRSPYAMQRRYVMFTGTNFYMGPFASDEIALRFPTIGGDNSSLNREGFVNSACDLKQPLFLGWFIELLTNETDIAVADRLTLAISDLAKEDFHPHDFERIVAWWHSHENEYTNWPVEEFNRGKAELITGDFSDAAKSFSQILKLDPSADMSRAIAITSCLEIGETNEAAELAKGFNNSTARWAEWAGAMIDIHTGSISNGTVRFAKLMKSNPVIPLLPEQNALLWRDMDWQLFQKLTSPVTPSP